MNLRHRLAYLAAMGIDCWVPRQSPPAAVAVEQAGALPGPLQDASQAPQPCQPGGQDAQQQDSQQEAWQLTAQLAEMDTPAHQLAAQDSGSSPELSQALAQPPPVQQQPPPVSQQQQAASPAPRPAVALAPAAESPPVSGECSPFRLAAIDATHDCLVVADLPWSGLEQFTDFHGRLLDNILRALRIAMEPSPRMGLFAWPMLPGVAATNHSYAREAVQAWLGNQYGLARRKTLLVFGRAAYSCLWPGPESFDDSCGFQWVSGMGFGVTCSLGEMLHIPQFKAEAWRHLRPLAVMQQSGTSQARTAPPEERYAE